MRWPDMLHAPDPAVVRDQDLRSWRAQFPETVAIADLTARQQGTIVGVIARLLTDPNGPLEVTVEDGTGQATAIWHTRRAVPALELGRALRLSGVVAVDPDGRRTMRNPASEPVAEPYQRTRSWAPAGLRRRRRPAKR